MARDWPLPLHHYVLQRETPATVQHGGDQRITSGRGIKATTQKDTYTSYIVSEAVKEADPPTCCPEKTTVKDYAISKKTCLYLILLGVIVWTPYSDIRRLNCIGITFFRKIVATNLNKTIFRQVIEECDKRPIIMRNGQK